MRALTNPLFYILVSISVSLISCKQQPDNQIKNLEQIRPQSAQKPTKVSTINAIDTLDTFLKTYANDSCSLKMAAVDIDSSQVKHFLNRFANKHFHVSCRDSSNQIFGHQEWSFKDSNQANEAFFNWLDQFDRQQPFKIGAANKLFQDYTLIVLAGKNIIKVNSSQKIAYKDWLRLLSGKFHNTYFKYIIWGQPKKLTKWYFYKKAQIQPL
ncbi:MAG: hypothetical protein ACKOWW_07505 [Flavobacteriales bacterium]